MKKVKEIPKRFKNIREVLENSVKLYPNHNAFIVKQKKSNKISYQNITYTEFLSKILMH